MDLPVFAERLSELIFDSEKNAREVAKEIGVSKTTIYEYLSGAKMPSLSNLIKLADYFQCAIDYLLGLEPERPALVFQPCKAFPARFEEVLKHFGITRYKLEQLTGISESTLYYWAKGQKTPNAESLILVCKKLDCRVDFLVGRSNIN